MSSIHRPEIRMAARKLRPGEPSFTEPILERLRTMPIEELDALLTPKEGIEVTNMNAELAQWYRKQEDRKREAKTLNSTLCNVQ